MGCPLKTMILVESKYSDIYIVILAGYLPTFSMGVPSYLLHGGYLRGRYLPYLFAPGSPLSVQT